MEGRAADMCSVNKDAWDALDEGTHNVVRGMTRHDIGYVAKTTAPMFLIMVFILIAAPELATWLPENMRTAPGG